QMVAAMYIRHCVDKAGVKKVVSLKPELIPTFHQFYYHASRIIADNKWVQEKHGGLEYRQHYANYAGNTADISLGPGDIYDADCALVKVDCQLHSGTGHQIIRKK